MIHDLMLRWVVTGLFVLTAAECGLAIIAKRRPWTLIVNHGLHFAMAVAMAVMAWPWGARVPTTGPAVFFLLAAVWFGATAVGYAWTVRISRLDDAGHSLDVCRHESSFAPCPLVHRIRHRAGWVNAGYGHDCDEHAAE